MSHRDADSLGDTAADLATAALALSRSFASAGTLWCWAPGAPQHAQHIAVEFVHPVIVGTKALPAVALVGDDAEATLRTMARAGDVVIVVAEADAPTAATLRRAEAWGLTTMWIVAGPRPSRGKADHLLWLSDEPAAWHDGSVVLGYHLLWELTHVCFEHPGLLEPAPELAEECTTCSDEGRLGEVLESRTGDATVRTAAGIEIVNTLMVGPVVPGDLVVVHAGTAITTVDA